MVWKGVRRTEQTPPVHVKDRVSARKASQTPPNPPEKVSIIHFSILFLGYRCYIEFAYNFIPQAFTQRHLHDDMHSIAEFPVMNARSAGWSSKHPQGSRREFLDSPVLPFLSALRWIIPRSHPLCPPTYVCRRAVAPSRTLLAWLGSLHVSSPRAVRQPLEPR